MTGIRVGLAAALLLAGGAHAADLPELWQALLVAPALAWVPGRGWAHQRAGGRWERELAAVWISLGALVGVTFLSRVAGLGAWGVLGGMGLVGVAGVRVPGPRAPAQHHTGVQVLALVLAAWAVWSWRDTLARPLEGYWYDAHVETGWTGATALPTTGGGWRTIQPLPGGARVYVPAEDHPYLLGPFAGGALLLLQGPVGAEVSVGPLHLTVSADPVEDPEEGPVPRYLDRGVASGLLEVPLARGERLPVHLSDPAHSALLLLPDVDAVWDLHGAGLLRHAHYYQLLNMVEQLRWARELGRTRWVTDVQPPLWSWILAGPLTVTGGALVTTNVWFGALVVACALAGVVVLRAWAPEAPAPAWLLPGAAAAIHTRLLLEPGSAGMPDTLYTLAALSALAALPRSPSGFAAAGLTAQLARYPGTLLTGLFALLAGDRRALTRLGLWVLLGMATFGLLGALTGALPGWLETVWWETGPEHWHGDTRPGVLLGRVPAFAETWVAYAGGAPVLAALAWPRGTRVALGGALLYALLLATVDHQPSHYFLPLVHLSVLAVGTTATSLRRPWARWLLVLVAGAGLFISWNRVPVTG